MLKYLFVIIALMASTLCGATETSSTIGDISAGNGSMQFSINQQESGTKSASLVAMDRHQINTVVFHLPRKTLEKMRIMVEATKTALETRPNIARETTTDIGSIYLPTSEMLGFTLYQKGDKREAWLFILGKSSINHVQLTMQNQDLQKLRGILDATITELDKK